MGYVIVRASDLANSPQGDKCSFSVPTIYVDGDMQYTGKTTVKGFVAGGRKALATHFATQPSAFSGKSAEGVSHNNNAPKYGEMVAVALSPDAVEELHAKNRAAMAQRETVIAGKNGK